MRKTKRTINIQLSLPIVLADQIPLTNDVRKEIVSLLAELMLAAAEAFVTKELHDEAH